MEMEFLVTVVVNEELRSRGQVEHYIPLGTRMAACNRKKKKSGSPQGSLSFFSLTNLEIIIEWLPWISGARGSYVFCFDTKAFCPEAHLVVWDVCGSSDVQPEEKAKDWKQDVVSAFAFKDQCQQLLTWLLSVLQWLQLSPVCMSSRL